MRARRAKPGVTRRRLIGGGVAVITSLLAPPALAGERPIVLPRRTMRTWKTFANGMTDLQPDMTYSVILALECGFDAVRLVFANDAGSGFTVSAAAVAPTTTIGDGFTPSGGVDSFNRATFHDAASASDGLLVPPTAAPGIVRFAFSDWIEMKSLPRADGSSLPLIVVRAHANAFWRGLPSYNRWAATPEENEGRIVAYAQHRGDCVSDLRAFRSPGVGGFSPVYAVQYRGRAPGLSLMGIGDSMLSGQSTKSGVFTFFTHAAFRLSRPDMPVSPINAAFGGKSSAIFQPWGLANLVAFRPEVVLIETWTMNDHPGDFAAADIMFRRAIEVVAAARDAGATPILLTSFPQPNVHGVVDQARRRQCRRCFDETPAGTLVFDVWSILNDPYADGSFRPGLSAEGVHLDTNGHRLLGEALVNFLERYL